MSLFRKPWESKNEKRRKRAVEKGKAPQEILIRLAKTDPSWRVRKAAVERVAEESVLIEIAKTDREDCVRDFAIQRITDENALIGIAKTDESSHNRRAAVERVADEKALLEISETDKDKYVREMAVDRVCKKIGHDYGKNCVSMRCKAEDHDFSGGKCARCGAAAEWIAPSSCLECGGTGTAPCSWQTLACSACEGTGTIEGYRRIVYSDGKRKELQ
jgi:hypothetical protein